MIAADAAADALGLVLFVPARIDLLEKMEHLIQKEMFTALGYTEWQEKLNAGPLVSTWEKDIHNVRRSPAMHAPSTSSSPLAPHAPYSVSDDVSNGDGGRGSRCPTWLLQETLSHALE